MQQIKQNAQHPVTPHVEEVDTSEDKPLRTGEISPQHHQPHVAIVAHVAHPPSSQPKQLPKVIAQEVDPSHEQGSSGGTNPLTRSNGANEEGYDADQTFMTMNSKEQEN